MELFGEASKKSAMDLHREGNAIRPGDLWEGTLQEPNNLMLFGWGPREQRGQKESAPSAAGSLSMSPKELFFCGWVSGFVCL